MSEPREAQRKGTLEALGPGGMGQAGLVTQIFEKGAFGKGQEITLEVPRGYRKVEGKLLGSREGDSGATRGFRKMLGSGGRGIVHQEDAGVLRSFWGAGGRQKSLIKK